MSATTGTAWVGVQLSAELAQARRKAGKSTLDIEYSGLMSRQKLWRIENGIGPWKLADVTALALMYGMPLERRVLLEDMARASRDDVWSE